MDNGLMNTKILESLTSIHSLRTLIPHTEGFEYQCDLCRSQCSKTLLVLLLRRTVGKYHLYSCSLLVFHLIIFTIYAEEKKLQ